MERDKRRSAEAANTASSVLTGRESLSITSSEQARADAMADAETLQLAWLTESREHRIHWTDLEAGRYAMIFHYDDAKGLSADSARAAFRAVPGLREE